MSEILKNCDFNSMLPESSEETPEQQYQLQHNYLDHKHYLNIMSIIKHDCPYISLSEPNIYRKDEPSFISTLTLNQCKDIVNLEANLRERSEHIKAYNAKSVHAMIETKKEIDKDKNTCQIFCVILFNFICIALYLIYGAIVFPIFEKTEVVKQHKIIADMRKNFIDLYQIKDEDLEEFLSAVITANDRGISPLRNASNDMNWAFGQAIFFSGSILTTIGYGRVTPLSQTGKLFCMFYAIIGIPYTLMIIGNIVKRFITLTDRFLNYLNTQLGHLYQPFNIRLIHLSIIVIIVGLLFFIIPTALFVNLEPSWTVLDAFYYCFISLTTIGLGDYVPGAGVSVENQSLYKIFITTYLIFGLMAMMLVITIYTDIPQQYLGQAFSTTTPTATMMKHSGNNSGDNEKSRLSGKNTTTYSGTESFSIYMAQRNDIDDGDNRRAIVRIRPHDNDSPSPDEGPTSSSLAATATKIN